MDEERVKEIRFKASSYSWKHGGSDLVRYIFELLDERTELHKENERLRGEHREALQRMDSWRMEAEAEKEWRGRLQEENEGLRKELNRITRVPSPHVTVYTTRIAELEDEDERLREDLLLSQQILLGVVGRLPESNVEGTWQYEAQQAALDMTDRIEAHNVNALKRIEEAR